jgi:hypothetical protein
MLEAILEDEEQVMEEDDRRIINKCEYSETRRDVARRNET